MNQLRSTDLQLGQYSVLFDWSSRIKRQKYDTDLDVEPLQLSCAESNAYILYITCIIFCPELCAFKRLLDLRKKVRFLTKWRERRKEMTAQKKHSCRGNL